MSHPQACRSRWVVGCSPSTHAPSCPRVERAQTWKSASIRSINQGQQGHGRYVTQHNRDLGQAMNINEGKWSFPNTWSLRTKENTLPEALDERKPYRKPNVPADTIGFQKHEKYWHTPLGSGWLCAACRHAAIPIPMGAISHQAWGQKGHGCVGGLVYSHRPLVGQTLSVIKYRQTTIVSKEWSESTRRLTLSGSLSLSLYNLD